MKQFDKAKLGHQHVRTLSKEWR